MADSVIVSVDDFDDPVEGDSGESVVEVQEEVAAGGDSKVASSDEETVEIEVEGQKAGVAPPDDRVAQIEKENRDLREALIKLSSRQQEVPQQQVAASAPKEEKVTRAQLVGILNENRDAEGNIRPDILMNIVDHLVEEKTQEAKVSAFKEFDQTNWKRQIAASSKSFMSSVNLEPQDREQVKEFVQNLKLEDNPAADMLGYALLRLSREMAGQPEESKKEKVVSEAPPVAKTGVAKMDKTQASSKKAAAAGGKVQLTTEQLQIAKRFGVKPETYAKFVGR